MANTPTVINQLPAHLQRMAAIIIPEGQEDAFDVEGGLPIGLLSLKGKVFTRRIRKEKEIIHVMRGTKQVPLQEIDVLFIGARPGVSKTFYIQNYEDGSDARPDCSSLDGIQPDPGVPHKQLIKEDGTRAASCKECKWDKFGTARQGSGKRCGDNKRVGVRWVGDPLNEDWGGTMLMRVPPSSFANYMEYTMDRKREGGHVTMCITRLSFDPEAPAPKLLFEFQRWLDEDETEFVLEVMKDPRLERVLSITQEELHPDAADTIAAGDTSELPAEETAPAVQQRSAAAEKLAAARTRAKATAPTGAAPKPNGQAAPVKPVAAKPAAVPTPAKITPKPAPAAATATPAKIVPMRPKPAAPAPVVDEREAKRQRLAAMLAEVQALDAELNPDEDGGEAAGEETLDAGAEEGGGEYTEYEEVEQGGEDGLTTTDDLMGEIDAELGALPD